MFRVISVLFVIWTVKAQDYYYQPRNVTRTTLAGFAAYRSALTLDWLAAEDSRQRDLVSAFETEAPPARFISTDCATYPKPAPGKIGRLMLELLKNLEGDEGSLIPELIQTLVRTKLLMETSAFEEEPDLEALVKTPGLMAGEPHTTFPRIVAIVWMLISDPATTNHYGWCPVRQVNKYLAVTKPRDVAKHMKALEVIVARARYVMEEFIHSITPVDMYQRKPNAPKRTKPIRQRKLEKKPNANRKSPSASHRMEPVHQLAMLQSGVVSLTEAQTVATPPLIDGSLMMLGNGEPRLQICKFVFACVCFIINCL